ncbi:portal protein [Streptococcus phage Javan273]|nr:phage portal protein [Streptococcus iniae]QBX16766.1 portal protein [Streptococcus phage Javan273]
MEEIDFLSGTRFNQNANRQFVMLQEDFEAIDYGSSKWIDQLKNYISSYKAEQLDRLKELKRYYLGDNNIKYRPKKTDIYAADNRISSDFAKYITIFEQGYMLGVPVEYKNEDEAVQLAIDVLSERNNEDYHNVKIKTDLSIYGRAYELLTVEKVDESSTEVKLYQLPAEQTFVIYDDTYQHNSLMGVHFYDIDYGSGKRKQIVKVYTGKTIYVYEDFNQDATGMTLKDTTQHFFNGVPINEFSNNEERTGAYESVMDNIDAYDLSQSELANFQQDAVDAILVISGNPYTGSDDNDYLEDGRINPNGRLGVSLGFKKAKIIILDDNPNPDGAKPQAYFLKKEYDTDGSDAYKNRLVSDILRFTFTPDTQDNNFAGTQSGESMKYKLMASDNYRGKQERLFKKGLMRRLRLAANIWSIKGNESVKYNLVNETSIVFTPNLPQNDNDLVTVAKSLYGIISDQTIFEILNTVTGVDAEAELERLKEEADEKMTIPEPRLAGGANGEEEPTAEPS